MTPHVSLVGAGPGDPDLLTRRAWHRLRSAESVFYDGLVPAAIVRIARDAKRVSVARRAGPKAIAEADVIAALVASAAEGRRTVRLKGGDPFVLGRGHDEITALSAAGVACEVVPGVTSATAAPLLAGIPLTARGLTAGFVVVSGHDIGAFAPALSTLAPGSLTLVVLMGMSHSALIRDTLLSAGWTPETPAAVITDASRPTQRTWIGALADLSPAPGSGPRPPGVMVIGRTVACAVPPARPESRGWRTHARR
jgi:uroporphyrin-III C-methyltransferase